METNYKAQYIQAELRETNYRAQYIQAELMETNYSSVYPGRVKGN